MYPHGASKIKLVTLIAEGLGKKPAYLLIFGICVLFFIFGIGSGIYSLNNPRPESIYIVISCFVGFVAALIVGVIVVRTVEVSVPQPESGQLESRADVPKLTGNQKIDQTLARINQGVIEAFQIDNKIFHEAILEACQNFLSDVADWEDGQFKAQDELYNRILLEFYEHAESTVFSTSVPDYISTWNGSLGERILRAHKESQASVTRVFVFNNKSEVTREVAEQMGTQNEIERIKVRLYFDEEDPNFNFPVDVGRDFTVIDDGEAIGITASFGGSSPTAIWFIKDEQRKPRFLKMRNSLLAGSVSFDSFYQWWQQHQQV